MSVREKVRKGQYVLFCIGLAGAIASCCASFYILYLSVLGKAVVVYEPCPVLALVEMMFLSLAIGTCVVAAEVYYRYLGARFCVR